MKHFITVKMYGAGIEASSEGKILMMERSISHSFGQILWGDPPKKSWLLELTEKDREILLKGDIKLLTKKYLPTQKYNYGRLLKVKRNIRFVKSNQHIQFKEIKNQFRIPKGRREPGESDKECAFREFEEETGIPSKYLTICDSYILRINRDKYKIYKCTIDADYKVELPISHESKGHVWI